MTTTYTFHLRNDQASSNTMWLFLEKPEFADASQEVFQNSNTFLEVPPYNPSSSQIITATVQYTLQVGQSSTPVALGNQIISTATVKASLNAGYQATYSSQQGGAPEIKAGTTTVPPEATNMVVETNPFSPVQNYYNSMTFGVMTSSGTTGVTWTPKPTYTYAITPTLTFYVAIGSYQANTLATITGGSTDVATCNTGPGGDFDQFNNIWVTYGVTGKWSTQNTPWSD